MKKFLTVSLLFVMLVMAFATVVNAATSADLADKLYAKGSKYGMTSADKVKIERFLADNPVTDADADKILAKADEAVAVMERAGAKNYSELTAGEKSELKAIANAAADIAGVKLVFKTSSVEVYKDGKLIETVTNNSGKLAYTGNNVNMVLVVSSIAVIALAITVVAKRTLVNA